MAYHYAFHLYSGERRRIRTGSLASYQGTYDWKVYDTEEERAAAHPTWYYATHFNRTVQEITAARAAEYWTRAHLLAGYILSQSEEEVRAILAAHPPRYSINPDTGEIARIQTWLPESERAPRTQHQGDFESGEAARASIPAPVHAMRIETGEFSLQYPFMVRQLRQRGGYVFGATRDECRAQVPVRYGMDDYGRYVRVYGRACVRPSTYAQNRRALIAAQEGRSQYYCGNSSIVRITYAAIEAMAAMFERKGAPNSYGDDYQEYMVLRRAEFVRRVAVRWPLAGVALCPCGNRITTRFSPTLGGRRICSGCASDYIPCAVCATLMTPEEVMEDRDGRSVCRTHWTASPDAIGRLMNYSTDVTKRKLPFLTAPGEGKPSLWLGWELECHAEGPPGSRGHDPDCDTCGGRGHYEDDDGDECSCDCEGPSVDLSGAITRIQQAAGDWAICKSDGSLDSNGIEIVSVPASLAWHRLNVAPFLEGAKQYLSGWPHNDCGIHIHVGRDQLSRLTQGKLVAFMHEPTHQDFITKVAGRAPGTYCVRGERKKKIPEYRREDRQGRYQALNFATRGSKTLEFRIFRSNVSPAGFMKNLEFVHALCHWAKLASARDFERGGMVEDFVLWVKNNRHDYPALVRYFERDGILPAPRVHPDVTVPSFILAA